MAVITGENMQGGYGGPPILNHCTIEANAHEITVIVGPNGAGKSTAMKALLGMLPLSEGRVCLRGEEILPFHHKSVWPEALALYRRHRISLLA